uniref:39S ribosomal protein L38, mitochondrial n=1 Tax=Parascaris univalens TaxID=6257 RepID=A0A915AEE4_PARUN
MRTKTGSIYADLYVKRSHRARRLPTLSRPWRPRVIAWAGPAAFYRNRFYEMDQWYKARIDKPEIIPELHIIDPDKYLQPLEERLKEAEQPRIDIGFKERKEKVLKKQIPREDLEKLSRTLQLRIDLKRVDHSVVPGIFHHFRLFDDLFGDNVFFRIVQRMIPSCGKYDVYFGNVLHAGDTIEQPKVVIESVGSGFNSLMALNLDGNPYSESEQILHWFLSNIEDGRDISSGTEVVPYLQALPFKGTGYHRFAFILFRHEKQIGFDAYRLKGNDLSDRIFSMQRFYKENEASLTPSSVAFAQVVWDVSVNKALHALGMKAPLYEYEYRSPLKVPQKEFPNKAQPFDLYLDQFRDPLEVEAELLKRRLRMSRVDERPQQPKYPDMNYAENKKKLPAWQHARLISENSGQGKNFALWNNPID